MSLESYLGIHEVCDFFDKRSFVGLIRNLQKHPVRTCHSQHKCKKRSHRKTLTNNCENKTYDLLGTVSVII